jgi:hypothetical protein
LGGAYERTKGSSSAIAGIEKDGHLGQQGKLKMKQIPSKAFDIQGSAALALEECFPPTGWETDSLNELVFASNSYSGLPLNYSLIRIEDNSRIQYRIL